MKMAPYLIFYLGFIKTQECLIKQAQALLFYLEFFETQEYLWNWPKTFSFTEDSLRLGNIYDTGPIPFLPGSISVAAPLPACWGGPWSHPRPAGRRPRDSPREVTPQLETVVTSGIPVGMDSAMIDKWELFWESWVPTLGCGCSFE